MAKFQWFSSGLHFFLVPCVVYSLPPHSLEVAASSRGQSDPCIVRQIAKVTGLALTQHFSTVDLKTLYKGAQFHYTHFVD